MQSAQNVLLTLGEGCRVQTIRDTWGEEEFIPAGSIGILLGPDIDHECVNIAFEWGSDTVNVREAGLKRLNSDN